MREIQELLENTTENIKNMIENGTNIYKLDYEENCALSIALINNKLSAADVILTQYENDIILVGKSYKGLIYIAITDEDVKTVEALKTTSNESPKRGTLIKVLSKNTARTLNKVTEIYISTRDELKLLNELNKNGLIDVNVKNVKAKSLLDIAVEINHLEMVKRLLMLGATINVRCYDAIERYGLYDLNVFQYSVAKGRLEIVEELLKNIKFEKLHPESKETLLHYAAFSGNEKVFKLIIKVLTNLDFSNVTDKNEEEKEVINKLLEHKLFKYNNDSILHELIKSKCFDLFMESLKYNPNLNVATKLKFDPNSLLDYAVLSNNLQLVKVLIEKGLEPHIFYGSDFNSLITSARENVNFEIFEEIIKNCPTEIFQKCTNGSKLALFHCIQNKAIRKVRYLINAGMDINFEYQNSNCLLECTRSGEIEMVKLIVDLLETDVKTNKKKYLNTPDYNKNYPIDLTVRLKANMDIFKYLLELGADLNVANRQGYTPLHFACLFKHQEAVKIMLEHGADVTKLNDKGDLPIQSAAKSGCYETFKLLLKKDTDVNMRNTKGQTFLICAARSNGVQLCEELVKAGADVNAANHEKYTALHYAENFDIINLLVKNGGNLMALNNYNCPPYLEYAYKWEWRAEGFKNHLKFDIDYSVINISKENLLHIILRENRHKKPILEMLPEIFTEEKFEPLFKYTDANIHGESLFYLACCNKNNPLEIVKKIFKFSEPDLNITIKKSGGAIHKLVENYHLEVLELILEKGADVELVGANGETPLIAAASKTVEMVELLLKYNANVNAQDELGDTPLHKAIKSNHFGIAGVLVAAGADLKITNFNDKKTALEYDTNCGISTFFNSFT